MKDLTARIGHHGAAGAPRKRHAPRPTLRTRPVPRMRSGPRLAELGELRGRVKLAGGGPARGSAARCVGRARMEVRAVDGKYVCADTCTTVGAPARERNWAGADWPRAPLANSQKLSPMNTAERGKDRILAGCLAIALGWLGAHHFYLGSHTAGVVVLAMSCCGVGLVVGLVEGAMLLAMTNSEFDAKYNRRKPESMEFVFQDVTY